MRFYYSPIVIARINAVIYYNDQCVNSYHTLPDLSAIDTDWADELVKIHRQIGVSKKNDSEDEEDIKVSILKGASNWVEFPR